MAPQSSTLAWKIPRIEEPGRLQSMGSQRVRHDWATSLSLFTFTHWRRNGNPLHCSCLENPRDGGAWWAAVYGVAQGGTWLKQLSSSSSKAIYCHPVYLTYMQSTSCKMLDWMNHKWNQDCWEKYQQPQICRWYHSNGRKGRETKEPLEEGERGELKAGLKLNIQKTKIMASSLIT